jgi:hypothetical protein
MRNPSSALQWDAEVLLVACSCRGDAVTVGAGEDVAAPRCWVGDLEGAVGVAERVAEPHGSEAAIEALLNFHLHLPALRARISNLEIVDDDERPSGNLYPGVRSDGLTSMRSPTTSGSAIGA